MYVYIYIYIEREREREYYCYLVKKRSLDFNNTRSCKHRQSEIKHVYKIDSELKLVPNYRAVYELHPPESKSLRHIKD